MSRLAKVVTGRRSKWLVVAVWIVLVGVFGSVGSKLADVTDDRTESFLPKNAESTEVLRTVNREFPGGQTRGGLIVYQRAGGLTAADKKKIVSDAELATKDPRIKLVGKPVVPFRKGKPVPGLVAPDGSLAYTVVAVPDDNKKLADWGKELRRTIHDTRDPGLKTYLTGDLGFSTDFEEVFGSLDTKLLFGTVLLVLVLLGAIYRAPLVAIIPLVVVGFAYVVTSGLVYLYAKAGNTVSQQSTSILVVL